MAFPLHKNPDLTSAIDPRAPIMPRADFLIRPMKSEEWRLLCEKTAAIDPWKTLHLDTEWLLQDLLQDPTVEARVADTTGTDIPVTVAGWVTFTRDGALRHFERLGVSDRILPLIRGQNGAYVRDIAVFEEWQGRGLGRLLLEPVAQAAKEVGLQCIYLSVSSFNRQARRFYERLGFTTILELPGVIHPDHSELVQMLELGSDSKVWH